MLASGGAGGRPPANQQSPVADVLAAAACAGIARVVTVGVDVASSRWAAQCAADYPDVYAAVAIHPSDVPSPSGAAISVEAIRELAVLPEVVAVGETGLDYYWDARPREDQQWWFRQHIAIAKDTGKALMIHDRDAHEDVLRILAADGAPERVVFHCFSGDGRLAKQCADAGYVMSFAGTVTFKNAGALREAASVAPADLVLVETDAPYLTPMPNRGKPNSPAMAAYTARFLADLKGIDLGSFCDTLRATAQRVFGWD
ncbi:MAG: TatD family hydrolase [Streptosporangiaceae bacterium]|nr:TatD family hydrolase [Streptosporangiaceae bacterium]